MHITFVIPALNERETLRPLVEGITEHTAPHDHTILFVDDGSTDGSYEEMCALRDEHPTVAVIRLRGNFGKSAALSAGFAKATGDIVFTMDADLQDDPKEIPRFLKMLEQGYDVVCGWKCIRHDPWHKRIPSRIYNGVVSRLFDVPLHDVNCGFKAFHRDVVKHIHVYGDLYRLIPVFAHNLNYSVTEIPVEHHPRRYGKSKYGRERLFRGAVDVLTMWFLGRYRLRPGHFFGNIGFAQVALGGFAFLAGIVDWVLGLSEPAGAAMCAVGLVFGATGTLTVCMGLMAELMLRHFMRIDPTVYIAENAEE
jgi:dolichol-phosphate mannosyltransferase